MKMSLKASLDKLGRWKILTLILKESSRRRLLIKIPG